MPGIPIAPRALEELAARHGGSLENVRGTREHVVRRLVSVRRAGLGELAPLTDARHVDDAKAALARGAFLLVDESLRASRDDVRALPAWVHPHASWALAEMLEVADAPADEAVVGDGCRIHERATLCARVRIGNRVTIGPGAVIGNTGFGFATGPGGRVRPIPQLGGVVIEDDVHIGANVTIDAGTLGPTAIRRGAKLDAQVHVGHNTEIGERTIVAAQTGFAGSVVVGRDCLIGGQVGVADHLVIGDRVRIAAKSGVIGDVPEGATVAGYPAVERHRWLRGLAELYKLASRATSNPPPPEVRAEGAADAARARDAREPEPE